MPESRLTEKCIKCGHIQVKHSAERNACPRIDKRTKKIIKERFTDQLFLGENNK